jgi:predicted TIM-barrel fold metal-dependent hydrolase
MPPLSRRGFLGTAGGCGLFGAAFGSTPAAAQQDSTCLPLDLSREDLVHLFEGPWRGLGAVVEKKVIDVHGHPYQLAQEPRTAADEPAIRARHDYKDFTEDLLESMDVHGIAKQCLAPPKVAWPVTYGECWEAVSKHPDRFIALCDPRPGATRQERMSLSSEQRYGFDNPKMAADVLRTRLKQGARGIGEVTFTQVDAKVAFPIVEVALEFDVPILFGVRSGGYADRSPGYIGEIAAQFPKAKIILGDAGGKTFIHGGGWDAVILMSAHDNVHLEIGGGPVELIDAAVKHVGAERILFGTDWSRPHPRNSLPPSARDAYLHWRNLNAVALSRTTDAQKDQILFRNAARLLKLEV